MRQVVQRGDDGPAVHLRLVDLLRAVIEAGRVAEADRVGGGEQAEGRVRADDPGLVEQGQAAGGFQHALDDEHDVRAAGVVFVEDERDIVLVGPGQDAVAEFGDLLALADDDGVLADEVDTGDVAVEVDAHTGPVEPCCDLLDVGRLAGAVIAGHHDAAVVGEAGQDRHRGGAVENIVRIDIRDIGVGLAVGGHFHVDIDSEHLAHVDAGVGHVGDVEFHLVHLASSERRRPLCGMSWGFRYRPSTGRRFSTIGMPGRLRGIVPRRPGRRHLRRDGAF